MLRLTEVISAGGPADATLTLPFEQRQRSRLRACLDDGTEVGLFLPRGQVLRGGDRLRSEEGLLVEVRAAAEPVSTGYAADPLLLARAAYHLGNRHVALQLGAGWVRYVHDHVLDQMIAAMGLNVRFDEAPFEPEAGAYH
ncbi:MAG: urease accessory protein UreE, partial [Pseudolabrys sp.]